MPSEVPNGFSVYHLKARDENGDGEEVHKYVMVGSGERKHVNALMLLYIQYSVAQNMFEVSEKTGHIRTVRTQYTLGMAYKVYVQVWWNALHQHNSLANLQAEDKHGQSSDVAVVDFFSDAVAKVINEAGAGTESKAL